MSRRRGNRGLELGVVLLMSELMSAGITTIPPVTLVTIVGQVLLYMGVIDTSWTKWDVCISAEKVISQRNFKSFVLSMFEHGDDMHLYYNMISYMMKGRSLESRYGSTNYAFFLCALSFLTSFMYVLLGEICATVLDDAYYLKVCAIGFSGVIFALKVVASYEEPPGRQFIQGISVSTRYAAWVELILIHILVPNSSFMGHLAGILAGVLYCYTSLGTIIDGCIVNITGEPFHHRSNNNAYSENRNSAYNEYYYDYDRWS